MCNKPWLGRRIRKSTPKDINSYYDNLTWAFHPLWAFFGTRTTYSTTLGPTFALLIISVPKFLFFRTFQGGQGAFLGLRQTICATRATEICLWTTQYERIPTQTEAKKDLPQYEFMLQRRYHATHSSHYVYKRRVILASSLYFSP